MSTDELWYDLYLYRVPENDKLTKIGHINFSDAVNLGVYWYKTNELHDYIIATEGSTPWQETPEITVQTPEWIFEECKKIMEEGLA